MATPTRIFLIGFMGAGKSTMGRQLAGKLNWDFVDLDREIEKQAKLTIPQIFNQKSEQYFRYLEWLELRRLRAREKIVVATGGGAPCYWSNMDWMNANGLTVFLNLTPELLCQRLLSEKNNRPLIRDISGQDLVGFIKQKLKSRAEAYRRAEMMLESSNIEAILTKLHRNRFNIG